MSPGLKLLNPSAGVFPHKVTELDSTGLDNFVPALPFLSKVSQALTSIRLGDPIPYGSKYKCPV